MGYNALSLCSCSKASRNRPQAIYLTSNRAARIASPQIRGLWRYSYYRRESRSSGKGKQPQRNTWRIESRLQSPASRPRRRSQSQSDRHHPWQNIGLGWGATKPSISGHSSSFWEARRACTKQRMEQIKKEIEADPYKALFGRRLEPFNLGGNHGGILASMIQSLLGRGQQPETHTRSSDTVARVKTTGCSSELRARNNQASTSSKEEDTLAETSGKGVNLEYKFDPISGRMVPLSSKAFNKTQTSQTAGDHGSADTLIKENETSIGNAGYLSSIDHIQSASNTDESIEIEHPKGNKNHLRPEETHPSESMDNQENDNTHKQEALGHLEETVINKIARSHDKDLDSRGVILDSHTEPRPEQTMQNTPTGFHETDQLGVINKSDNECPVISSISPEISSVSRPLRDVKQSDAWITQVEKEEDLDLLRASDIRAAYALGVNSRKTNVQDLESRHGLEMAFKSYQDPVKDLDAQSIRAKYHSLSESTLSENLPISTLSGAETQASPETIVPGTSTIPHDASELIGGPSEQSHAIQAPRISSSSTAVYGLLVYDPSTMQVIEAETKSSLQWVDTSLSPVEVLSRLNHLDKFVPYIVKMNKHGYEIVSGGGDVIFFRQAAIDSLDHRSKPLSSRSKQEDIIAGFPTSSSSLPHLSVPDQTPSDGRLNSNTSSRARTVLRGFLISSMATIATCYAIGVVVEYFRTGGQDGFGIDGFTEFESERRHRDRK